MLGFESVYQSYRTSASGWVAQMRKLGRVPADQLETLILDVSAFRFAISDSFN